MGRCHLSKELKLVRESAKIPELFRRRDSRCKDPNTGVHLVSFQISKDASLLVAAKD